MSIEANKKWRLGAAIALMAGWTTWLAAVPGPGTGHSFTSLASPFTQDLYATTGNLGGPLAILGGVAFTPDGRVWSAECSFLGTRLHRFASATTAVNGSSVHDEELVVDLTATGPLGFAAGGCGLVNHPDGSMYSSSKTGIWQLNATTGQPVAGPFGNGANGLGIAVDPQAGHHLVYVGKDCHPSLDPAGTTCTLWDLDPVTHTSLVFARLTRAEFMLIDGLYFDPSGNFLFAAHRQVDIDDDTGVRSDHNSLQIIRRPAALLPVNAPIDDTQSLPVVPMVSEPDGVAFHAAGGFVVTLNESGDCLDGTNHVVGSNPTTHLCAAGTTAIGGTMTRFDFGNGYALPPTVVSTFAYGGFRGDLMQVGPDGCIYATQAPLAASGGTLGTRFDNDVTTSDNSLVQICGGGGFVPPPGVTHEGTAPGSIAGLVFFDANDNGVRDSGEGGLADVLVTLSTDPTHPLSSAVDGTFLFDQLAAGTYTVTTPATTLYLAGSIGHSTVISSGAITLAAGEQKTGLAFGYAPGSIAGTVFQDLNYNTVRDSGEPSLGGVLVTLAGAATGNASSHAADGSYTFNLLASASYTVSVPGTAGALVLTTVGSRSVTLGVREHKIGVDFGYAPPIGLACVTTTTGEVGVAYSASLAVTGGRSPFVYAIATGSLPPGLSLEPSTGAITGTPTTAGPFSFTAQVVDANGATATTNGCGITIAPAPPALSCVAAITGQVGVAYTSSLVATGGVSPYLYSIVSGSLPAGLSLNASTGVITGTPTTAGPFAFTAKVVDARNNASGTTTSSNCGITIAPAPPALVCAAATTGQVGVAYNSSLVATGGVSPYIYSIMSGNLPIGLTLNASTGAISGTPTTAGPFALTAKVVDSRGTAAGTTTNNSCGITVAPVAQVPGLSITKSANTTTYTSVGQVIVYTYVITNIGNVTLTGPFTVTDDKLGVLPCTTATSLGPGASITCTANYVIKASDLGTVLSLPSGVVANVDTGAWLQGVLSTQDTTISGAGPGVPNGIYPGWCIQDYVPTDLHNQPATLYSTIGGNLPADMAGRHWNQINYALNHKIRGAGKSNLEFFKDVQTAIWVLNGEQNPEFGISATAQQMINEANAHPTFVPGPSDVVAVIVYSDGIAAQIRSGEIQESIIEMELKASITNHAAGAGKLGTVTITSNQAQVTVTQVIFVLSPDVVSMTQSAASAAIASAGLTVGATTTALSSIVPSGGVASQTPAAGMSVASGSAVALVISSGAPALGPAVDKMIFSDGTGKRTTAPFSTASPGEVLIAFATSDGPSWGGQTLTVAGAGLTWTLVRRANTQLGTAEIWKAKAVSTLTNVTVSSTQSAGGYHQSLSVVTFMRATGVGASAAAGAATGAPTVSLTTTKANSLVFATGNDWDKALARTVGPNQQMIHQWMDIGTGDTHWLQAGSAAISAVGTLFKSNDTAPTTDHWNLAAVEIVP